MLFKKRAITICLSLLLSSFASIAVAKERSGKEIYQDICSSCHTDGQYNAPKVGDKSTWAPLIAKGKNTLYKNTFKGVNVMPAHGFVAQIAMY
jgi:cytochrome c5